jgi:peptide/nickel transport system substrate-binding protein
VDEWVQGSQITLKRNEYFKTANPNLTNKGVAPFDTIVVRFIPDEFTRVSELESGDVDIIYNVPTTSMADLETDPNINVYSYLQPGVSYLNLQTEKGLLSDINVRMALSYAVDRDELNAALDGVVTPTYGFISEAQAGYSATEEAKLAGELAFAPDKAKSLLADAGWADTDGDGIVEKDGQKLSFEMLLPSDRASLKASGPVLQKQFAAIGVDAQIREYEADYIKQQMREDQYDMGSRNFEWADADILYYVFTEESGYPWDDPAVTAALVAARQENDTAKRVEAYAVASELLSKDFKGISLFADNYIIASKGNITGLVVTNDGRSWFSDVAKS